MTDEKEKVREGSQAGTAAELRYGRNHARWNGLPSQRRSSGQYDEHQEERQEGQRQEEEEGTEKFIVLLL